MQHGVTQSPVEPEAHQVRQVRPDHRTIGQQLHTRLAAPARAVETCFIIDPVGLHVAQRLPQHANILKLQKRLVRRRGQIRSYHGLAIQPRVLLPVRQLALATRTQLQ
jgi:hypothetical protein